MIEIDRIIMIDRNNMMEGSKIIKKREIFKRRISIKHTKIKIRKKMQNLSNNNKMVQVRINSKIRELILLKMRKRKKNLILFPIQISNGL